MATKTKPRKAKKSNWTSTKSKSDDIALVGVAAEPSKNGHTPKKASKPKKHSADDSALGNGTPPDESLKAIRDAEAALLDAEESYEDARIAAREAKATKEKLRKKLHTIIQEETGLEPTLWQNTNGTAAERKSKEAVKDAADANASASDEETRKTSLESLGLAKGLVAKLAGAGISTLGDYYDYVKVNEHGWGKRITDIKGIGKGAVDKIEAAVLEYVEELAKRRTEKAAEVVEKVAEAAAVDESAQVNESAGSEEKVNSK
jgi:hypothetical protein